MKNMFMCLILSILVLKGKSEDQDQKQEQIELLTRSKNEKSASRLLQTSIVGLSTSRTFSNRFARITEQPIAHNQWRSQILNGVYTIPNLDPSFSYTLVFGQNAAIIAVSDGVEDIYISAAELGLGRVILMPSSGYLINFTSTNSQLAKLHSNMKKWVTRYQYSSNLNFTTAQNYVISTSGSTYLGLYSTESSNTVYTAEHRTKLLNFVKNGGGIIVSVNTYNWVYGPSPSRDVNNMLNYQLLLEAGIRPLLYQTFSYLSIYTNNSNVQYSHLSIQINKLLSPEIPQFKYSYQLISIILNLPAEHQAELRRLIIALFPRAFVYPSLDTPITKNYDKLRLFLYFLSVIKTSKPKFVALGYEKFPGKVDITNPLFKYHQDQLFTFNSTKFSQYFHTGFYAVAGQTITVNIIKGSLTSPSQFFIGLHDLVVSFQSAWNRWPDVLISRKLDQTSFSIISPFGGLIVLKSSSSLTQTVEITLSNVVEAPFFDSQNATSVADWTTRRKTPGPWGVVKGKYIGFCLPRSSLVSLDDPSMILNMYDDIFSAFYTLRGSKPALQKSIYFVSDVADHNYFSDDWTIETDVSEADPTNVKFPLNYASTLSNGNWENFEKIGKYAVRSWWYFNLDLTLIDVFALKGMEIATGVQSKYAPQFVRQKNKIQAYLNNPNFTVWSNDAGIGLGIYVQMIEDFGWNTLQKVFTWYETGNSNTFPTDTQGKIDLFWSRYSIEAGQNLTPLLTKWGIPFTTNFTTAVSALPIYTEKVNIFA